jgi:hypothetical protein
MATTADLQALVNADPALQQYYKALQQIGVGGVYGPGRIPQAVQEKLQALSAQLPPQSKAILAQVSNANMAINPKTGQVGDVGFDPIAKWVMGLTLAAAGGLAAAGTLAGSAAATLPSTTVGTGAATLPDVVPSGLLTGATAGGTAAAGGSAAGGATAGSILAGADPATAIPGGVAAADASSAPVISGAAAGATAPTTFSQIANLLKAGGSLVGGAATAAGQNQINQGAQQTQTATAVENAYLNDATVEQSQRNADLKNTYREGVVSSGTKSPYDPVAPAYGADYLAAVKNLSTQGAADLAQAPIYGIRNIPNPQQLFPNPATAYQPSTGQTVANWLAPALSIAGNIPPSVYSSIWNALT